MVDTLQRNGSDTPAGAVRTVGRRRALPNSRAIVGALLITASVFGVFWSWSASSRPPTTTFVTATRDLVIGDTITAADLRLTAADLPESLRRHAVFSDAAVVVGAVVVGPIRAGELVQAGAVAQRLGDAGLRELSVSLEEPRALAGRLRPGDRVDVLATFGAGGDTYTTAVARDVLVLRVARDGSGLGGRATITLSLGLRPTDDALAIAHAVNVGDVMLLRAAARESSPPDTDEPVYRAPKAGDEAGSAEP